MKFSVHTRSQDDPTHLRANARVAGRLEGHRRHDTAADPNEDRPDEPAVIRERMKTNRVDVGPRLTVVHVVRLSVSGLDIRNG
jgi:hypothetical protein